jgi:hypothetical protein
LVLTACKYSFDNSEGEIVVFVEFYYIQINLHQNIEGEYHSHYEARTEFHTGFTFKG